MRIEQATLRQRNGQHGLFLPTGVKARHYTNLDKTEGRLLRLVKDFEFMKLSDGLNALFQV